MGLDSVYLMWSESEYAGYKHQVEIYSPPDGSCYFHSIIMGFYRPYRTQNSKERAKYILALRRDLGISLRDGKYTHLSRGQLQSHAKTFNKYSIENMISELCSKRSVDTLYHELISDELEKDIYIVDRRSRDVIMFSSDHDLLYKRRPSIVLLYTEETDDSVGHYDLMGILEPDGCIATYFEHCHPYIQKLYKRYLEKCPK
jgi:hypothetical protein